MMSRIISLPSNPVCLSWEIKVIDHLLHLFFSFLLGLSFARMYKCCVIVPPIQFSIINFRYFVHFPCDSNYFRKHNDVVFPFPKCSL